jgi:hypothetical protein
LSYVRCSILGVMLTSEVWSINPTFDPTAEFGTTVSQSALDSAALAIANMAIPTELMEVMSNKVSRTGCRLEVRDDASDALLAISTQASGAAQPGSSNLTQTPQSAVVISVLTDTPGPSGRGRLYWPALGVTLDAQGRIATPNTGAIISGAATYLHGIEDKLATAFPTIGFDLSVRSKTTKTTPHAVRLRVGNVVDTQRRRRDNLPESYTAVAF